MATGFYTWSQTASANATADTAVNYQEGQAPSSLNDSARAAMASLARYRDDIAGAIATGGTSTAYTVSSFSAFDTLAHMNGQMIAFTPHTTSGATVTLNVDGLGAKPLRSAPSVELPAGVLVQGTPYVATYNNSDGAWYLQGLYGNPYGIPLGGLLWFTGTTAPNSSFVFPYGQAISRTSYAAYFSLVGTTYGSGDGSTTFNILNMREKAIFGWAGMGGGSASAITTAGCGIDGATVGASGGAQNVTVAQANLPNVTWPNTLGVQRSGSVAVQFGGSPANNVVNNGSGPGANLTGGGGALNSGNLSINDTQSWSIIGSTTSGGSGTALNKMPPAIILPCLLRVS